MTQGDPCFQFIKLSVEQKTLIVCTVRCEGRKENKDAMRERVKWES